MLFMLFTPVKTRLRIRIKKKKKKLFSLFSTVGYYERNKSKANYHGGNQYNSQGTEQEFKKITKQQMYSGETTSKGDTGAGTLTRSPKGSLAT